MDWAVVAGLLLKYGPELVEKIIANWQNNKPVTVEEWQRLDAKLLPTGTDLIPKKVT